MLREPCPRQYQSETLTLRTGAKDHLARQIDARIDVEFIRKTVAHGASLSGGRVAE